MIHLLVRMSIWIRRRPSREFAGALIGVAILVAASLAVEAIWGWPEWLTAERPRGFRRLGGIDPIE